MNPYVQDGANVFDRCGAAARSDLLTADWSSLFEELQRVDEEFKSCESAIRSPEYKWPRDPLHTWSRVWEYPYVLHHLRAMAAGGQGGDGGQVLDLGAGVTFFPFAVARLGFKVTCLDTDPIGRSDIPRAAKLLKSAPGEVQFRLIEGQRLPVDDVSVRAVYCVSVLEHIPQFEDTIAEIVRALKPGGTLILTVDVDHRGDWEIGVDRYHDLLRTLRASFTWVYPESTVHPADLITPVNSRFPLSLPAGPRRLWFLLKQHGIKPLFGRRPRPLLPYHLSVHAFVLRKR